jgi:hypothetical protein
MGSSLPAVPYVVSANTPENAVKKKIDAALKPFKKRKVLTYNKTAGSMFGSNGWPDYAGCFYGFFWAIEAKHCPKRPTDIQQLRLDEIKDAGGVTLVINETNVGKLTEFFTRWEAHILKGHARVDS